MFFFCPTLSIPVFISNVKDISLGLEEIKINKLYKVICSWIFHWISMIITLERLTINVSWVSHVQAEHFLMLLLQVRFGWIFHFCAVLLVCLGLGTKIIWFGVRKAPWFELMWTTDGFGLHRYRYNIKIAEMISSCPYKYDSGCGWPWRL